MPLTEDQKILRFQVCAECGAHLTKWQNAQTGESYFACMYGKHRGIAREAQTFIPNMETWRKDMEQHGEQKTTALEKYVYKTQLTRGEASEIIDKLWPTANRASPAEVFKAVTLCAQYQLNPLMNHMFLIPYEKKDKSGNIVGTTYVTTLGIKANRLIAARKHRYSYVDYTPRRMTEEEEVRIFGEVDKNKVRFITKLKDMPSGAEAPGYGEWSISKTIKFNDGATKTYRNEPLGIDKGNSMENMAAIRSERQCLDRLYPADMPGADIPVVDERFESSVEVTVEKEQVDQKTGEIVSNEENEIPEEETESAPTPTKSKSETPEKEKTKKEPTQIKSLGDLCQACWDNWKMSRDQVAKESGYLRVEEITDPANAFEQIKALHKTAQREAK